MSRFMPKSLDYAELVLFGSPTGWLLPQSPVLSCLVPFTVGGSDQ